MKFASLDSLNIIIATWVWLYDIKIGHAFTYIPFLYHPLDAHNANDTKEVIKLGDNT
jgi:hypothetical protein